MKNISMKKIYAYAFGVLMLAGAAALVPTTHASAAVFNDNAFGIDCPTVAVANATRGTAPDSNGCWGTMSTAGANDVVNAVIYYHNNGTDTAHNVVARLSPQSAGISSTQIFSGSISASNAPTVTGSGSINISPAENITFGTVKWYKDKNLSAPTPLPGGQTGAELFSSGLNLGDVLPYTDCAVVGGVRDAACHEGWLMVSYRVGAAVASSTCQISITPAVSSVPQNGSTTISWTSNGCTNFSISGPGISSTAPVGTNQPTGALTTNATYTATGYSSNGQQVSQQAVVNVSTPATCQITSASGPGSVSTGSTATLIWTTTNCTSITVAGSNVSYTTSNLSQVQSGSTVTGIMNSAVTYTVTATNGSTTDTRYVTVTPNGGNTCTASITASQTQVQPGQTVQLNWSTTSGCTSVLVSGPNGTISTALFGPQSVTVNNTATYTITASGTNSSYASVTVTTGNNSALSATTNSATNVTANSATLNGYIYNNGSNCSYSCGNNGTYYFQYGTSQYGLTSQTPTQTFFNNSGPVSANVNNLLSNTTYYFQLVATNGYSTVYGGTLSFVTTGNSSSVTALTLLATNVTSTSVRLNGLVATSGAAYGTTYFEYGTSPSMTRQTSAQNIANGSSTNYFDTIATSPNTTYYYRIAASVGGQMYYGSTISFTTPGATAAPVVVTTRVIGTGGGSAYVSLSITDQPQNVTPGDVIMYTVTYQNISGSILSNAILNVILPTGVTFRQASQGLLTTNNTVAATLGTLLPNAGGTITITAVADLGVTVGSTLVTTATLAFTTPSNAQDSAIAYVLNNVGMQNNLAGLALFGNGFFPTSLLGWILLLGILLILILIARYFYHRADANRRVAPAVQYYAQAPAPGPQAPQGGYQGDHLPH